MAAGGRKDRWRVCAHTCVCMCVLKCECMCLCAFANVCLCIAQHRCCRNTAVGGYSPNEECNSDIKKAIILRKRSAFSSQTICLKKDKLKNDYIYISYACKHKGTKQKRIQ